MLSKILYYLVIFPISLLPFSLLYIFSDILAFVLEYIIKYRNQVITNNLTNSFPEKSVKEIKLIKHKFYSHFSDLVLESLKGFNLSEKEVKKRVKFENIDDLEKFFEQGKDVMIVLGHYGNWEMVGSAIPLFISHKLLAVYKPLSNAFFDEKMKETRSQFGVVLSAMKEINKKAFHDYGKPKALCFAADQSPSNPKNCYWTTFLNQETGVLFGTEKFAKTLNIPIVYMVINKPKRGYYKINFTTLFENPQETEMGEITKAHIKHLEKDIIKQPEFWLWSHKRWKHKRTENQKLS